MGYTNLIYDILNGWSKDYYDRKLDVFFSMTDFDYFKETYFSSLITNDCIKILDSNKDKKIIIDLLRLKYNIWLEIDEFSIIVSKELPSAFKVIKSINNHNHFYTPKEFSIDSILYFSNTGSYGNCNWKKGIPLWENLNVIEGTTIIPYVQIDYEYIEPFISEISI
jgi:hypothetical protein